MRYLLDTTKLQPADVVLETGTKPHSRAIAAVTGGRHSHALLFTNRSLIEATVGGGVFSKNPQRLLVRKETRLEVYRMREPLAPAAVEAILMAAGTKIGSLYAVDEAMRVIWRDPTSRAKSGQFCSRLVAQCYAAAGISLVRVPDFCSPHDLAQSPLLQVVPNAVRPASQADLDFADTLDIILQNQKATMRWLKGARRIASRENQTIATQADVLPFLLRNPKYDAELMSYIRRTSYLENQHHDRVANPHRYETAALLELLVHDPSQSDEILQQEIAKEPALIRRYGHNLNAYRNHAHTGLSYVDEHIKLFDQLLATIEERLETMLSTLAVLRMQNTLHAKQCSTMLQEVRSLRI